jgi:O-antigen/teichoic acid export membrane protein
MSIDTSTVSSRLRRGRFEPAGGRRPRPEPVPSTPAPVPAAARGVDLASKRGAAVLSIGTLASGLLAYAFNVLAARSLGPAAYGPVAVLWAAVFLSAVVLFRPLEQTLSRSIAERKAHGIDAHNVVKSVGRVAVAITAVALIVCLIAWTPITDTLFAGQSGLTLALAVSILGYCLSYLVRGVVGGLRWFGGYGVLLLADGGVRLLVAAPLVFIASPGVAATAVALAAIGGAIAPLVARRHRLRDRLQEPASAEFDVYEALRFAGPVTAVAAAEQVLVSGGPLLVMLAGGSGAAAAAGVVFAATMLVRGPVFLFQGISAALLPSLTRLDALGDRARFRRSVLQVVAMVGVFSGLLVAGALAVGPQAMNLLYGDGFEATRFELAILCAGIGAYLLAATLSQAVLARGQARAAGTIWGVSAIAFVVIELLSTGTALHRVSVAFAAAAFLMGALFVALVTRRRSEAQS